jgi:hypothetical protein
MKIKCTYLFILFLLSFTVYCQENVTIQRDSYLSTNAACPKTDY